MLKLDIYKQSAVKNVKFKNLNTLCKQMSINLNY